MTLTKYFHTNARYIIIDNLLNEHFSVDVWDVHWITLDRNTWDVSPGETLLCDHTYKVLSNKFKRKCIDSFLKVFCFIVSDFKQKWFFFS